jgi:hypothetical protein
MGGGAQHRGTASPCKLNVSKHQSVDLINSAWPYIARITSRKNHNDIQLIQRMDLRSAQWGNPTEQQDQLVSIGGMFNREVLISNTLNEFNDDVRRLRNLEQDHHFGH